MNIPEAISNWYRTAIRDPRYRWWIILGSIVYLISPIDLIPDVPIVGWIDDGVIATVLIAELSQILMERLKAVKADRPEATVSEASEATTVDTQAQEVE